MLIIYLGRDGGPAVVALIITCGALTRYRAGWPWQGYLANRNRTFKHLYDNEIGNNAFLAGDSHQNWVCRC